MKSQTVNTVEDLVRLATTLKDERFVLEKNSYQEWVDAEAGHGWDDDEDVLIEKYGYRGEDERDEAKSAWNEHLKVLPAQKTIINYFLTRRVSHGEQIRLSEELGARVAAVWTVENSSYGGLKVFLKRTGALTLAGILKRLGETDALLQIEEARSKLDAERERNKRNSARRELKRAWEQFEKALTNAGAVGLDVKYYEIDHALFEEEK